LKKSGNTDDNFEKVGGTVSDNINNFALNMFRTNIMQYSNENQDGRNFFKKFSTDNALVTPRDKVANLKAGSNGFKFAAIQRHLSTAEGSSHHGRQETLNGTNRRRLSVDGQRA
jgi:hypothetical protein